MIIIKKQSNRLTGIYFNFLLSFVLVYFILEDNSSQYFQWS